ncbi:isochorismatase family protein [Virgibacillus dakarensis]|uniref:Isochorismatase n=1 Tax=Lentibacillus populi TaxID=1827502 RepID=A0A9W5U1S7_9BACI|nr:MULTISPECIES: isochorismatase family protein [Bacillaceae]MBT2216864.1 isochorismatase family protein [Virgibacillus dakarensis]MTW88114.1 isochorismatase family protein [Virgibacillus dakarensis]GGB62530.1 isochorismatase [Lentibacillus populi]
MKQALLIIDVQQELVDGNKEEKSVFNKEVLLDHVNAVINKALKSHALIVFMRDKDVADGKGPGFQIHKKVNVPTTAKIFDKAATNSFYGTALMDFLKENEVEHLVIMGCQTEHCIDTAVRTATVNHFDVTLVGDGHSTTDSSTLSAEKIISHHNEILHGHYNVDHFSVVRTAQEDLFEPIHDSYR